MNLSFQIACPDESSFIAHWSAKYSYRTESKYTENIGKPLTDESRQALFEWKNGGVISGPKLASIQRNYPLIFNGDQRQRYLNPSEPGGPIWNIFYLHCLEPESWPILDQHTFRAMKYIQTGTIVEIGTTPKQTYSAYLDEYKPFIDSLEEADGRRLDKALFAFGQFLKMAARYA